MVINMTRPITFIHAADLHLDSPFQGLSKLPDTIFSQVRESTFDALQQLIKLAISRQVDFVLLVGDLFDHERQSLKAQIRLRSAFEQLADYDIQVYLSYGNHDFIEGNYHAVSYPANVHSFPDEAPSSFTFTKQHERVEITGFSYETRAVTEEKVLQFPERDPAATYQIGMLHGSVYGDKQHSTYAPFSTHQLVDKEYDYWALGHIHQRQELHEKPPIIYPGNIQSRHRNEQGKKGCYVVELKDDEVIPEFVPFRTIEFLHIDITLTSQHNMDEVETLIEEKVNNEGGPKTLLSINWHTEDINWFTSYTDGWLEDLLEGFNEQQTESLHWIYIYRHKMNWREQQQVSTDYSPFLKEINQAFTELDIQKELKDFTKQTKAKKYADISYKEIQDEAQELLYTYLHQAERRE
ncbi:MAG TPA: DNA repair exonuclease [Pseudogracilibacillus sp.]|nr:DNA repair exonuclease [Pseudogracilibacillus sp.]